jgi:hypothetical protein
MTIKHNRTIIRNPEEVDCRKIASENVTRDYLLGHMSVQQYLSHLKQMDEYVDFRRLAADIQRGEMLRLIPQRD